MHYILVILIWWIVFGVQENGFSFVPTTNDSLDLEKSYESNAK